MYLYIYIYITRLASNEIFSPSNKIHREVGRAKDLSAPQYIYKEVLISPYPDQEGNKLQRQKILSFIYPIYNHNWRNISTIYIYNKTSIKRNILTIKIYREVGRAKDLSAPLYKGADKSFARPGRKQATATEDFEFHISYL